MGALEKLIEVIDKHADAIFELAEAVERITPKDEPPPQPWPFTIVLTGEEHQTTGERIVDLIKFKVAVPAESTPDVVKREVNVTLADGTVLSGEVSGRDAAESQEFKGDQDSTVIISLVNVDDAGNKSVPRVQSFTLLDTVAPPEPGELGITVTGEEHT